MKKIVLLVAFLFLLVGCNQMEMDSPTKKVETFLNKYQTHDEDVINEFDVTMFEEENLSDEQKERYREIMLNQYKDMTYKIKEEKIDGNKAEVEVEIEVYDYNTALTNSYTYMEENKDEFFIDEVLDAVKFINYKLDQLFNYKERITYNIKFNLTRENSKSEWFLEELNEMDLQKIHGIYSN